MTKQELKTAAVQKGNMILNRGRNRWGIVQDRLIFWEITHFFNKDNQEIGFIAFEGSSAESVHIFNPPRIWGRESLNSLNFC